MVIQQPVNQIRLTNVSVVRLKRNGLRFEIACYRNKVLDYKKGLETDLSEILHSETIFNNVSKGQFAKTEDLQKAFHTKDVSRIALTILDEGNFQVSQEERQDALKKIFQRVATDASKKIYQKRSRLPIPHTTVKGLLEKAGFSPSLTLPFKRQVLAAVRLLLKHYPDDLGKYHMLIRASVASRSQIQAVESFVSASQGTISPSADTEGSPSSHNLTFYLDPQHYRGFETLMTSQLQPPGTFQVVSMNEPPPLAPEARVDNSHDKNSQVNLPSIENDPASSILESTQADNFILVTATDAKQLDAGKTEADPFLCTICKASFGTRKLYKEHYGSDWHNFNVKRDVKKLPSVDLKTFKEFYLDVACGLETEFDVD